MIMQTKDMLKNIRLVRYLFYTSQSRREISGFVSGKRFVLKNKGIRINTIFRVKGNDNKIIIDRNAVLKNTLIVIHGNNAMVHIENGAFISGATLWVENNCCSIIIGERTFVGPSHLASTEDGNSIVIGKDCMLSSNINIRTGDSHSIIDISNGKKINDAKSVKIGDHCWIGEGAKVLKGVVLADDCIVGTGAIVTKSYPSSVLVGGVPARIIKENVNWDNRRIL